MVVSIPCPECGAVLKLADRSKLGRTGKCPKCGHRFTLSEPEPDEVELELAGSEPEQPLRVSAARRVPPEGSAGRSSSVAVSPMETDATAFPAIAESGLADAGTQRFRDLERKRARARRRGIVFGGLVAFVVAGATWGAFRYLDTLPEKPTSNEPPPPKQDAVYLSERDRLERLAGLIAADSPTQGDPISLRYVPDGASIIVHLRPADLWKQGSVAEETRFCLGGDFKLWSEQQIETWCLLPPDQIEEATLCVILGARGSPPQIAAVVRPVTPLKTSELIQKFNGSPESIRGVQVYVGPERSYVAGRELDDQKRPLLFATAPAAMSQDLAAVTSVDGFTSDALTQLLEQSDRQRDLTVLFQPNDLRGHAAALTRQDLLPIWQQMLDRFGPQTEAVLWSLHLSGDDFLSELHVRNVSTTTPSQFISELRGRLDKVPVDLVAAVSTLDPATMGERKLVGRLPAMMQLFSAATVAGIDTRRVVLQTRLPERAGPNIALAGLLAWHESTMAGTRPPVSPGEPATPAAPLAERLKTPIEIDFRRTPLEEVFIYIGGETGVEFDIDGDALKLAAYTRNMPQTMALGKVPAEKAIAAILANYDKMAVVLDDAAGKAIVTTLSAAEEKGLTPATFAP